MQAAIGGYSIITGDYEFRSNENESFIGVMNRWHEKGTAGEEYVIQFSLVTAKGDIKISKGFDRPDALANSASSWMISESNGEAGFHYFGIAQASGHHSAIITMMIDKNGVAAFWFSDQIEDNKNPEESAMSAKELDNEMLFRVRNNMTDGDLKTNPDAPAKPIPAGPDGKSVHAIDTPIRKLIIPKDR